MDLLTILNICTIYQKAKPPGLISPVVLSSSLKDGKECVITPLSQKSLYKLTDTFYFITKEPDSYVYVKEGPLSVGKIVLSIVQLVKIILSLAKSSSISPVVRPSSSVLFGVFNPTGRPRFVDNHSSGLCHRVPYLPGLESGGGK